MLARRFKPTVCAEQHGLQNLPALWREKAVRYANIKNARRVLLSADCQKDVLRAQKTSLKEFEKRSIYLRFITQAQVLIILLLIITS